MNENTTAIPNIIFDIGLKAQELVLYTIIKSYSDENGLCQKSTKELAKVSRISKTEVPKIKKALALPRKELNDKALITIEKRIYEDGTILPDNIYITNLDEKQLELKKEKD